MSLFPVLSLVLTLLAGDPAGGGRLTFTKSFPGSSPDYYRITLQENGEAFYSTSPPGEKPEDKNDASDEGKFRLSPELAAQAFELSAKLHHFRGADLETRKKLAFMGKKTVVYENGAERGEAVFNYSENPDAMAVAELFEKISNTQQHRLELERLARYDKLGLMKQLLIVETSLNKKDLAEPSLLVPVLEKIAANKTYLNIAQQRARIILAKIQPAKIQTPQ